MHMYVIYTQARTCTYVGVCACVGVQPSKQPEQKTEHYIKVDWIMRKYRTVHREKKNRVTESIFPTDPASPNAFPFTQGTVLYCIWSC